MLLIVGAFASGDTTFTVGWRWFTVDLNLAGLGIVMAVLFGAALAVLFYLTLSTSGRLHLHSLIHRFAPASVKPKVEGLIDSFFEGLQALRSPVDLGAWHC